LPRVSRLPRRAAFAALAVTLLAAGALAALWIVLPDPTPLARENPRTTALIEQRRTEAKERRRAFRPRQTWVGLDRISPRLVQAVLLSEDANFFGHEGIDWDAMREAAEHDVRAGRFARGASTLTQQLAKNLWLETEKSLWRKVKEAVLAAKLERAVPKKRILGLYLNVVEMADGVFGVEAGARHRFGTGAADLSAAQAVVLASMLPAPRRVDLARPSTWLRSRSRRLLDRMREVGRIGPEEHLRASAELERILAGPSPSDDREEPPEEELGDVAAVKSATPTSARPEHSAAGGSAESKGTATGTATPTPTPTATATGTATPTPTPTATATPTPTATPTATATATATGGAQP
jgi:monofunctional biosynthetic peptidoglycan transglycosylase